MSKFKVGDWVKVIDTDGGPAQEKYLDDMGCVEWTYINVCSVHFLDGCTLTFKDSRLEAISTPNLAPIQNSLIPNDDYNTCTCDLFTVIMRTGCVCGGK